ncbi:MAG TPA: TIGR02453 family protein [Gemmatimonadales bacterium]|nr:TIGR02453 family protein [Gemmatimonadales bacterium]
MPWFVYVARCRDGTLYTGVTTDPAARERAHNAGRGAAYTRSRLPVSLVHLEPAAGRGAALRRELAIKRLKRKEKEAMVAGDAVAARFGGFRPEALGFLRRLKRNNRREWFERNRAVYEAEVRDPMRALVEEMDARLARLAPELTGDPKHSVFRIHRDVRFSADKSPYKTNAACQFYHQDAGRGAGQDAQGAGAGLYFQLADGQCFVAGGMWMPARPALERIREGLAESREALDRLVRAPGFRRRFRRLDAEAMLKRMPRGYADDHPAADWLRYRSFTATRMMTEQEVLSSRLPGILARDFAALAPLVRWINRALGYEAWTRRF